MIRITKGLMIAALILSAASISAQNLKFGHINSQELLMAMPERDSAEAKLKKFAKNLQDEIETLQVEFNKKYQNFQIFNNVHRSSSKQLNKITKSSKAN